MDARWSNLFYEIVADVWHKYGPFAALLVLIVMAYETAMTKLWMARIKDKDGEIERLVKERNRLQDVIVKRRLSSKRNGDD